MALLETGLVVKPGSERLTETGDADEMTSHWVRKDNEGKVVGRYVNEEKFFATFLLRVPPSHNEEYEGIPATTPSGGGTKRGAGSRQIIDRQ